MKNKIAFIVLGAMLAGCMQDYPEQGNDGDGRDKACNLIKYVSNISVQFNSHSTLPSKLSGTVNGAATINECTMGNDTDTYSTVRINDRSVQVVLWVERNAVMRNEYFDDEGRPIQGKQINLVLKGRNNCSDTPSQIFQTTRTLNWQPVYSNSNKNCSPSGYTAIISN